MSESIRNTWVIFKREFGSYFESPVAYVFLVVFLVMINSLAFLWPSFPLFERGVADLQPLFFWLPLVFLILVPAATMGCWAEERRSGTIELLLTMPITMTQAIIGKFMAAWTFIVLATLLTFPVVITVADLGDPDMGVVACGYLGAVFMAGAYVAIGMFTSSVTRSQVIAFVISVLICLVLVLAGTPFITNIFMKWRESEMIQLGLAIAIAGVLVVIGTLVLTTLLIRAKCSPLLSLGIGGVASVLLTWWRWNLIRGRVVKALVDFVVEYVPSISFWTHFQSLQRGVVEMRDIAYYVSVMVFALFVSYIVLDNRKSA